MRPIYFCYPSLFSIVFINYWLRIHRLPLSAVVVSATHAFKKGKPLTLWQTVKLIKKHSGWRYLWYEFSISILTEVLMVILSLIVPSRLRLHRFKELSKQYKFDILYVNNFCSSEVLDFCRQHNCNIAISAFNNQIFRKKLIDWFNKFYGIFNIHPALLPDFRGYDPIVPALINKQPFIGATLHCIDKYVDCGSIIAQCKVDVLEKDDLITLNYKAFVQGSFLLHDLFKSCIEHNVACMSQSKLTKRFGYYSQPSVEDIKRLVIIRKNISTFSNIWRILCCIKIDDV